MAVFPSAGSSNNSWGDELRTFFSRFFNLNTGNVVPASFDHTTDLSNVGTNTHAQIDSSLAATAASLGAASGIATLDANSKIVQEPASKAAASGIASLDANSKVVQNPASAIAASTATSIPISDSNGDLAPEWINQPSGETVLASSFSMVGGNNVFVDTGVSLTLPAAGTYLLAARVRGSITITTGIGYIRFKLYNSTDAADVANSVTLLTDQSGLAQDATATLNTIVTVAAAKTIKLYAAENHSGGFTNAFILSDTSGFTSMLYVRIA